MSRPVTSLQLYSVKELLDRDLDGTLSRLATIGFDTVEPYDFVRRPTELAAAFTRHGLAATSGHAFLASESITTPTGDVVALPTHEEVFAAASELGMSIVIDPYTEPSRWTDRFEIAQTAKRLNAAAQAAAGLGMRVGYHNHGQEFTVVDGTYGLELLAADLDPDVVLEVDLYWATVGGVDDVPALIERLGQRVVAVHVKDGALDPDLVSQLPPRGQTPAGEGSVDLRASLAAATALELAVIEFDAYDGDLLDAIEQSFQFLAAG